MTAPIIALVIIIAAYFFGPLAVLHAIGTIFLYIGAIAGIGAAWFIIGEG